MAIRFAGGRDRADFARAQTLEVLARDVLQAKLEEPRRESARRLRIERDAKLEAIREARARGRGEARLDAPDQREVTRCMVEDGLVEARRVFDAAGAIAERGGFDEPRL